jgi:hypothetical protein
MVYYVNGSRNVGKKMLQRPKILKSEPPPQADSILPEGERVSQVIRHKKGIFLCPVAVKIGRAGTNCPKL